MTTYNTGNPIGSIDPRDLLDNAQNLDEALLTENKTFVDRLGRTRTSWEGAIKYSVLSENYSAGIEVTTRNQIIFSAGEWWAISGATPLPYTTTGAGMPESGAFQSVGDAKLRGDLSQSSGITLVGGASIKFNNIQSMRDAPWLKVGDVVETYGYRNIFDRGGNVFLIVESNTGTDDGGEYINLTASGLQAKGSFPGGKFMAEQWGAYADGVNDDTAPINACLLSKNALDLQAADYLVSETIKTKKRTRIQGSGSDSNIIGDNISGPIILTYPGTGTPAAPNQSIGHFNVSGSATVGIAFAHCTLAVVDRVTCEGLSAVNAFVFEYFWGSSFSNLSTNGAVFSGVPFKLNRVVLDSEFNLLYTSNLSDSLLALDSSVTEFSTGDGVGEGRIVFNTPTLQGARKHAITINGYSSVKFNNAYTENNVHIMDIKKGTDISFSDCNLSGITAASEYDIWVDSTGSGGTISGVSFRNCLFANKKHIFGDITSDVNVSSVRVVGNLSFFDSVERTTDTPSSMAMTVTEQRSGGSRQIMKTSDFSWKFSVFQTRDNAGSPGWHGTIQVPAVTALTKTT